MKKRILISILLVGIISISTIMGTYAVIINVISENVVDKIVNKKCFIKHLLLIIQLFIYFSNNL